MGFISWVKSDDNESISAFGSIRGVKTVYLVQPQDENICELNYQGYGIFGGVDAFVWLAVMNLGVSENDCNYDELRNFGLNIHFGFDIFKDENGALFSNECDLKLSVLMFQKGCENLPDNVSDLTQIELPALTYPLKFSANENAEYAKLNASLDCPYQGFHYDD